MEERPGGYLSVLSLAVRNREVNFDHREKDLANGCLREREERKGGNAVGKPVWLITKLNGGFMT